MDKSNKLEIINVSKKFGSKQILSSITTEFDSNKIYGLLGNNGAGKTTLIKIIFNELKKDNGEIKFNNKKSFSYNKWFYYPENNDLPKAITGMEYLKTISTLSFFTKKKFEKNLELVLKIIEIDFNLNSKIKNYSTGQQKILSLMALLIFKPNVIFLDEPTANLDMKNKKIVLDVIKKLKSEKRIIVIITHLIKEVEEVLTDYVILDSGKIVYSSKNNKNIEKVFFEKTLINNKTKKNQIEDHLSE